MRYLVVAYFWFSSLVGFSQLTVKSLSTTANARLSEQAESTISLPFWDDFSKPPGILDTTRWLPKSQAQVIYKTGIGIDPPTIGVVTFDGIDAFGNPYLNTPTDGAVDSLVTQLIDLTQVPDNLRNSVYLSFFYQSKGLGEAPEKQDSLILYFKDVDGVWNKVWPTNIHDNYTTNPTVFTERFIQISNSKYFHPAFQFMFKATGRQNGWFDNWLVDYVYLNQERSSTDNSYLDRAFTAPASSIFEQYTAIPFDDFVATVNKNSLFTSTTTKLRNLENDIQPIEYSVELYDTLHHVLLESIISNKPLILDAKELKELTDKAINPAVLDLTADSLYLMLEYSVKSGDKFLIDSVYNNHADTAYLSYVNDKTQAYFNLHDYYAYDDGTAEFAAGFNQPQGKIAYQYQVIVGKYLDRIDIYFPNVDGVQTGIPLELFVLDDFEESENSLLKSSNISISHTGINQFVEFKLSPPLFVTDTFFIGFTNLSSNNQWLSVGLDKNTDSFDKIYVNIDGNWVKNSTVHGSLMMRPHFTAEPPIIGITNNSEAHLAVYPNPSYGQFQLNFPYNTLRLIDLFGRNLPFTSNSSGNIGYQINTPQLLILLIETDSGSYSKRIIANPTNR